LDFFLESWRLAFAGEPAFIVAAVVWDCALRTVPKHKSVLEKEDVRRERVVALLTFCGEVSFMFE